MRTGNIDGVIHGSQMQVVYDSGTIGKGNLLFNGNFESWVAGTSSAPDGWAAETNVTVAREGTIKKISSYSLKMTNGATVPATVYQTFTDSARWKSATLYYGAWVYADEANKARVELRDVTAGSSTFSSYHTGVAGWEWLTVTKTMDASCVEFRVSCRVDYVGNYIAYYDGAILMTSAVPASNTDTSYFDQTSISVTGLNGDNDDTYEIYGYLVNGYDSGTILRIHPNGDTAANYGFQMVYGADTTTGAGRDTAEIGLRLCGTDDLGQVSLGVGTLYAKSGYVRTYIAKRAYGISGTTVAQLDLWGQSWNNTANNITSLLISSGVSTNGIGVGSRIIILRRNSLTSGSRTGVLDVQGQLKGCWQTVYKTTLAAAATSVSITGLDGDTAVMYRLKLRLVAGGDDVVPYITFNTDTATNYGEQSLQGVNATASAARVTNRSQFYLGQSNNIDTNELSLVETLIYAKSGNMRVGITESNTKIATTTVNGVELLGQSWDNSANNIIQIVLSNGVTNGLGIGTVIELEAYRPQ